MGRVKEGIREGQLPLKTFREATWKSTTAKASSGIFIYESTFKNTDHRWDKGTTGSFQLSLSLTPSLFLSLSLTSRTSIRGIPFKLNCFNNRFLPMVEGKINIKLTAGSNHDLLTRDLFISPKWALWLSLGKPQGLYTS